MNPSDLFAVPCPVCRAPVGRACLRVSARERMIDHRWHVGRFIIALFQVRTTSNGHGPNTPPTKG